MQVTISSGVVRALHAAARVDPAHECCGILYGDGHIDRAELVANVAADPECRFEIDPAALIAAHRAARNGGPPVAGYFHSHPTGTTTPSATDRAMAAPDGRIWAIVAAGAIGWWRSTCDGFVRLDVIVVD